MQKKKKKSIFDTIYVDMGHNFITTLAFQNTLFPAINYLLLTLKLPINYLL